MTIQYTNQLIHETSPYLLQHAHNPVNWYAWTTEALALAKRENKPILLSIGYSACHWCHVMAHESFEEVATAELMNKFFVNIKVDREERPDLDKIYQLSHQLLTQHAGGWPLTVFLEPERHCPFFSGTYFPSTPRHNLPAFKELLQKVHEFYHDHQKDIQEQYHALATTLERQHKSFTTEAIHINSKPLDLIRQQLAEHFDNQEGGFGKAPKFPHLPSIERLLRHYIITAQQDKADEEGLDMALFTLRKMALGGIYDQLGGGFCRYSVDDQWTIPHFEKMLYDNGAFLSIYTQAWQLTAEPLFKKVVLETADWILREMQSPEGGFYSSLDADSEGEEGKFYVWTLETVKSLLDEDTYALVAYHFGLDQSANFEGQWHLVVRHDEEAVAKHFDLSVEHVKTVLTTARQTLLTARASKIPPGRDEKILTAWNALMIKGLAQAGQVFQRADYLSAAEQALDFLKERLWFNGQLLATYKDGKAHLNAYLDDYAFLLDAILTLLQARWRDGDLRWAIQLADSLLTAFADTEQGGFYFTAHYHERLISRPKSFFDESMPSGNSVAAIALARLGHLTGEMRYLHSAEQVIKTIWPNLLKMAYAYTTLLVAVEEYLLPPPTIILRGEPEQLRQWQEACAEGRYTLRQLCFAIPNHATDLPGFLAERKPQGNIVAYLCSGTQCSAPITSLETFREERFALSYLPMR